MRIGSDARDGRPRLEAASSDLWSCHSPCWSAKYDSGTHRHRVQGEVSALSPMRSGRNDCSACAGNTHNRGCGQSLGSTIAHRNSTHVPDESKVARNLGTLTFHRYRENRRIPTIPFQTLKYAKGNYVRHFWGTTPARRLGGTTTPDQIYLSLTTAAPCHPLSCPSPTVTAASRTLSRPRSHPSPTGAAASRTLSRPRSRHLCPRFLWPHT